MWFVSKIGKCSLLNNKKVLKIKALYLLNGGVNPFCICHTSFNNHLVTICQSYFFFSIIGHMCGKASVRLHTIFGCKSPLWVVDEMVEEGRYQSSHSKTNYAGALCSTIHVIQTPSAVPI